MNKEEGENKIWDETKKADLNIRTVFKSKYKQGIIPFQIKLLANI
jgi:hypothetical protein